MTLEALAHTLSEAKLGRKKWTSFSIEIHSDPTASYWTKLPWRRKNPERLSESK